MQAVRHFQAVAHISLDKKGGLTMQALSLGIGLVSLSYLLVLWAIYRGRTTWRLAKRYAIKVVKKAEGYLPNGLTFPNLGNVRLLQKPTEA